VIIIVRDFAQCGANWARNQGFRHVRSEFVLFSNDDISWKPDALAVLLGTLQAAPDAAYAYGSYHLGRDLLCLDQFGPDLLRQRNYISTMSLIRSEAFPGFDESIKMLQDWDLWLTMLAQGKRGVHCGRTIFHTGRRRGITLNEEVTVEQAVHTIRQKHRLP
jgi:Glycosyl transferase family 2